MPSAFDIACTTLVQRLRTVEDPATADVLQYIIDELKRIGYIVDPPPTTQSKGGLAEVIVPPPEILYFTYRITSRNVVLEWLPPSVETLFYEIRRGATWETAERVSITSSLVAILNPIPTGITRFLIKAINQHNVYSLNASSVDIIIPEIGETHISPTILGNNVLLYWTIPTSIFEISYYIILRNNAEIARLNSTFLSYVELAAATLQFSVIPVDVGGNQGPRADVVVVVTAPPDYIQQATLVSTFTGTKVNALVEFNKLLVCVNTTETWNDHFVNHGWDQIIDQIAAGFSIYIQPALTNASYKETFDFGVIYENVILNINYDFQQIIGINNIGIHTEVSDNGTTWGPPTDSLQFLVTSVRYVRVTVNFTGTDDDLLYFFNFRVSASIHLENDGGNDVAVATDVGGTVINFNKPFKAVDSITVTPISVTSCYAVVIFTSVPNPTNFKIMVFDNAGLRITKPIQWDARGVI